MGVYWSRMRVSRPNGSERIPFIPDDEFEALYTASGAAPERAQEPAGRGRTARHVSDTVAAEFNATAAPVGSTGRELRVHGHRRAPREILGPLAAGPTFEIRPDTLARRVLFDDGAAVGAELLDRISGARTRYGPDASWCGDALRTPQLLRVVASPRVGPPPQRPLQMTAMIKLLDEFVRAIPGTGERTATGSVLTHSSPGRPMQG